MAEDLFSNSAILSADQASPLANLRGNSPPIKFLRLRSMKHEKEHGHAEAAKGVERRREDRYRGNQVAQRINDIEDEGPRQKSSKNNRSDQCQ